MKGLKMLLLILIILTVSWVFVFGIKMYEENYRQELEDNRPTWKCDLIDCGNIRLVKAQFEGPLVYWRLKGCNLFNCTEVEK